MDDKALRNGCVAAYVGAWHYGKQIAAVGNTWDAVGYYHSATPARRRWYANAIAKILMSWEVIPPGPPPFVGVPLLAPGSTQAPTSRAQASVNSQSATIFDAAAGQ